MRGTFILAKIKRGLNVIKEINNWTDYFLNSLHLMQKKQFILKMKNGLRYIIRTKTTDAYLFVETVLDDQYIIKKINLPENPVIIDAGAQNGFFSVYISDKAKKIFSFEPVSKNFDLLLKSINLNKLENKIIPFNLALSNKNGKERIFLSEKHTGGHSVYGCCKGNKNNSSYLKQFLKSKGFNKKNFIDVNSITLTEILKANKIDCCHLLKMDIEGAEYRVFYSLPDSCFKKIQRIVMECHNMDKQKNNDSFLIKFLESKGYNLQCNGLTLFAEKKLK